MATWPTILDPRAWLLKGYTIEPVIHVSRDEDNLGGVPRQRREMVCSDAVITCSMLLSQSELNTFETFFFDDLVGGADEFTGPFYDGNGTRTGTLQIINGDYSIKRILQDRNLVSMNILIQDRQQLNEAEIVQLLDGTITYSEYLAAIE